MAAPPAGQDAKCGMSPGNPLLLDLSRKAFNILDVFEELPADIQMEGLDVLQNVVNSVMHKITRGRVTAVKFVPVEGSAMTEESMALNPTATVKEEPVDPSWSITSSDDLNSSTVSCPQTQVNGNPDITPDRQDSTVSNYSKKPRIPKRNSSQNNKTNKANNHPPNVQSQPSVQNNTSSTGKVKPANKRKKKSPQGKSLKPGTADIIDGVSKKKGRISTKTTGQGPEADSKNNGDKGSSPARSTTADIKDKCNQDTGKVTQQDDSPISSHGENGMLTPESDKTVTPTKPEVQPLHPFELSPTLPKSTCNPDMLALLPDKMRVIPPEKRKKRVARKVPGRFQCSHCSYSSDKKFHFDAHLIVHTGEKRFCCDECDKVFTAASSLKRHVMAHQGVKPHECPICGRTFTDMAGLRTHSVVHTGERLYACEQCDKVYTNSANLSRHRRVHTGEMPYVCKVGECEARFRDLSSLKLHNLKHTGEKPYTCEFCGMRFKTSSDYLRHKRSHTNERNYECDLCGKKFIQGWHLKQHQKMHNDLRPWQCDLCDKKFRSKASLKHHTKWHAGIKDYSCPTCGKKFSTKKYLEAHQVIHTNLKPYKCKTCGTYFNQISNLKRHERMHSDVRKYKCNFCPKAFKYINSWRYHEGIHKGDMLTCEKCGVSMRSVQGLKAHKCTPTAMEKRITAGTGASNNNSHFESFVSESKGHNGDTDLEDLDEDERREILESQGISDNFDQNPNITNQKKKAIDDASNGQGLSATRKLTIKPLRIRLPKLPLPISDIRSHSRKQRTPKKTGLKKKIKCTDRVQNENVNCCAMEIKAEPIEDKDLADCISGIESHEINKEIINFSGGTAEKSTCNGDVIGTAYFSRKEEVTKDAEQVNKSGSLVSSHKSNENLVPQLNGLNGQSNAGEEVNGEILGSEAQNSLNDMTLMKDAYVS